jgi:acyl-CoA synthetase (AMP-forming)/AMP-acid ligase II
MRPMTRHDTLSPERLSLIHGPPLSEEPGLGALTLPGFIGEVAARHAGREALVMHAADGTVTRWTYAELGRRAEAVARSLIAGGLDKGARVGVMMTNRPEWLAAVFGVGLAGGVAVGLSTFSTPSELGFLLKASAVSTLLFEPQVAKKDFRAMLEALAPAVARARPGELASPEFPFLRRLVVLDRPGSGAIEAWPDFLAAGRDVDLARVSARVEATSPADPGVLLFSSGTSGKPKGILNSHRAVAIQCWRWARLPGLDETTRTWSPNGFFWSGNFAIGMGGTLAAGGCLVLQPTFDPAEALRLLEAERVTYPYAWPHQWAQLEAAPGWAAADLSSFRHFDVEQNLRERQPTITTRWLESRWSYGSTETFTVSTAYPAQTPKAVGEGTSGPALPGMSVKVVDPLTGATAPRGQTGEIAVKGATLMLGYVGAPIDETLDAEGFFRTGDGGFIDEGGRLVFQGRLNDIVKTGGANVSPVEVDNLLATCPGVKVCKTVGVPHATLGEMVVSCVAPEPARTLTEVSVRDFLRAQLASYKVPRRVFFVRESELELTGSAKVKADGVRKLAAARLKAEEETQDERCEPAG